MRSQRGQKGAEPVVGSCEKQYRLSQFRVAVEVGHVASCWRWAKHGQNHVPASSASIFGIRRIQKQPRLIYCTLHAMQRACV